MHPTTKKSSRYGVIIVLAAVLINLICFRISTWFMFVLFGAVVFASDKFKVGLSDIVMVSVFSILSDLIILVVIYLMPSPRFLKEPYLNYTVVVTGVIVFFILFLLLSLDSRFDRLISFIKEKNEIMIRFKIIRV